MNRQRFQMRDKRLRVIVVPLGLRALLPIAVVVAALLPAASLGADASRVTPEDQLESAVLDELNLVRLEHGRNQLRLNPRLTAAADHHSLEMVAQWLLRARVGGRKPLRATDQVVLPAADSAPAVDGRREPHLADPAADGPRRRGLLARQPRSPRQPAQASFPRSRHLGRPCAGRPGRLREPARRRPHGRLRRPLASPAWPRSAPAGRSPAPPSARAAGCALLAGSCCAHCPRSGHLPATRQTTECVSWLHRAPGYPSRGRL